MLTLHEHYHESRWTWAEIEAALLEIPLHHWSITLRFGMSDEDGERVQREGIATDLRRELGVCHACGK